MALIAAGPFLLICSLWSYPMGWADWMIVREKSLEEELELERTVREIRACTDAEALRKLCEAMALQSWHHTKLLKQAVEHIASIDRI